MKVKEFNGLLKATAEKLKKETGAVVKITAKMDPMKGIDAFDDLIEKASDELFEELNGLIKVFNKGLEDYEEDKTGAGNKEPETPPEESENPAPPPEKETVKSKETKAPVTPPPVDKPKQTRTKKTKPDVNPIESAVLDLFSHIPPKEIPELKQATLIVLAMLKR